MHLGVIVLLLWQVSAQAYEVKVIDGLKHYKMTLTPQKLSLKGSGINLSLKAESCNEKIFKVANAHFGQAIKNMPVHKSSGPDHIEVVLDGKKHILHRLSMAGKYFQILPIEVERMKIEDRLRCIKK